MMTLFHIHRTGSVSFRRRSAFVLLEAIISIMILGVAIAALLRSFTVSLATVRRSQIVTTSCLLGQQVLEEFEVVPPQGDHDEGKFLSPEQGEYETDETGDRGKYRNYYWEVDIEEEEVDYPDVSFEGEIDEFETLTRIKLTIIYDDKKMKRFTPVHIETYLTNTEKFTYTSKRENKQY